MGAASRRNAPGLRRLLDEEGYRFEFFQAVRLLQRERPGSTPVGAGDDPAREAIRFASKVSLSFSPSDVAGIELAETDEDRSRLEVSFLGAASPASYGSLPTPYAELILGLERGRNHAFKDFLDRFNHRFVSLFYRAWEKYRYALAYERDSMRGPGTFERAMFSLLGMGTEAQRGRLALDDRALLARSQAVGARPVSAQGLVDLVRSYFRVPVQVQQFVSCWYPIEQSERSRLGAASCTLGRDFSLGSRVHLAQSRFRLKLGPLDWDTFRDLLPTGKGFAPLVEMTRLAAGPEFDFDCQLILDADSAPGIRLTGSADASSGAPQLGWSTWLHTEPLATDPADVIIDGDRALAPTTA